jgi:hypothetical protein
MPVNAFVLYAEPVVIIDSGLSTAGKNFVSAVAEVLDPADVRWLWITTRTATTPAGSGRSSTPRRQPGW